MTMLLYALTLLCPCHGDQYQLVSELVFTVVYVRMHWLALEVPMCTCMARMSALSMSSSSAVEWSVAVHTGQ